MWIDKILKQNRKIMALSPMADMTDSPFCRIVRQISKDGDPAPQGCGGPIVFREMVSSEALVRDNKKTLRMIEFHKEERPIVQQIFGADPLTMAKAAEIVMEHSNPDGIDINMGCPVYKIISNFNGCALMKNSDLASKIIKEVKSVIGETPLSVKIRLGWSSPDDFKSFIPVIERAGVDLITIHGRTKEQGYSGKSDWARIAEAKKIATVPLLANGDIHEPYQVTEVLDITLADGVMIARGALGNPWFFMLCANPSTRTHARYGASLRNVRNYEIDVSLEERKKIVMEHARLHNEHYGGQKITTFRKHLSWYFKTNKIGEVLPNIKDWRGKLMRVNSLEELENLLKELK